MVAMKKTLVDWEEMIVEFDDNEGRHVTIQGDPTLAFTVVVMNSLHKISEVKYQALEWEASSEELQCDLKGVDVEKKERL